MEEGRVVLRFRCMPAGGVVRSQEVLEVLQGDHQRSYEASPWPAIVNGTEIIIRKDDWSMDWLYGKAPAFGIPYSAVRELLPGITGAGFIAQAGSGSWILWAGRHRTASTHRIRVMK